MKRQWEKNSIKNIGFHFQGMYYTAVVIPGSKHINIFCDGIKIDVVSHEMKEALNRAISTHN